VVLNLGERAARFSPEQLPFAGRIALGIDYRREGEEVQNEVKLGGNEGVVIALVTGQQNA
jgi:hypothetical protein